MDKNKILIVEDAAAISFYMKVLLEENGYCVTDTVISGEDAIKSVEENQPDLIMMDIILEGKLDGIETSRIINKKYNIPVIYVSANTDDTNLNNAAKTGPYGFIVKPINEKELLISIKNALYKHKIEKELLEKDKKYRILFENMQDSFIYLKSEYRNEQEFDAVITELNREFEKLTGISRKKLLGRKISEIFPDISKYKPDWKHILFEAAEKQKPRKLKINLKKLNKWLNISIFSPEKGFLSAIIEDITENIAYEKTIRETEDKFRIITTTAHDAIVMADEKGIITFWNPAATRIFGYTQEEAIGMNQNEIIKTEIDKNLFIPPGNRLDKTGRKKSYGKTVELEAKDKFGNDLALELSFTSAKLQGKWQRIGIIRDVTGRKLELLEIKKVHNEINSLLTSIDSIIIGVSKDDRITHWNYTAEKTFGIKSDEVLEKNITDTKIKWEWDKIFEGISVSLSEMKTSHINNISYTDKNNRDGFLEITISPILQTKELLSGFIIYGKDITEQRIMEMQLLNDQKLKSIGELASGIAHEINTPIQYINDNIFFLKNSFNSLNEIINYNIRVASQNKDPAESDHIKKDISRLIKKHDAQYLMDEIPTAIEQTIDGIVRISDIVRSMKNFSHPGTGKKVLQNINKALSDTLTISKNEWKYAAEVKTDFDETLEDVSCYAAELNQVFLNIIVNASHAIEEAKSGGLIKKGLITISTGKKDKWVYIKIKDNGTGIPENIRDKIFNPFFTTKEAGKGTGQGLAIAHQIITEKHKGRIEVRSKINKGTEFTILIPQDG